jgi:hypothetical protein
MATITSLAYAGGVTAATRQWAPVPTLYSNDIDFAAALTAKGSALAAADVIEAIRIPDDVYVHWAGIQTIAVDDATTLTLDLGTDVDPDNWVDGYDQAAAIAGAYATSIIPGTTAAVNFSVTAANSIDVTLATLTGTLTVGKIRVFALVTDMTGIKEPGLAQVGD